MSPASQPQPAATPQPAADPQSAAEPETVAKPKSGPDATPLNRQTAREKVGRRAPVRIVHLGLGAFHRAHQAWFTQRAETDPENPAWGIAAFTGRSPAAADELSPQDGLYTLVTRSAGGDEFEVMTPLVETRPAGDTERLVELLSSPDVAVVTLTVTEAGYHLDPNGDLDAAAPDVAADVAAVSQTFRAGGPDAAGTFPALHTAAGRLVLGLAHRVQTLGAEAGIAVVSCDNMADNAAAVRNAVLETARAVDPELAERIGEAVSWVGTSVDRITPATTDELRRHVREATGFADVAPVVTEPFVSWILQGDFPAGRPAWEKAGAQLVDDLEPFERRKLWLLNGSHTLMAYAGQLVGVETVDQAIDDPAIRPAVEAFWDEAARHLTDPGLAVADYREALAARFRNPRIRHSLEQIGSDGAAKLRVRAVPVLRAEREASRSGEAAAEPIGAWIAWLRRRNGVEDLADSEASAIGEALTREDPVAALLNVLQPGTGDDPGIHELVSSATKRWEGA